MASEPGVGVPVACGAIGEVDPDVVARIASNLDAQVREVHRDERSILFLDRPPARWQEPDGTWGLGWCERVPDRSGQATSWREAASHGACGLAADGEDRIVHASASGVAPLYWMRSGAAAYFATTVDALARARIGSLEPDWDSWGAILRVGYPYEGRTPFAQIGRLMPGASLSCPDGGGPGASEGRLDWLEREATDPASASEEIVAGLRAEIDGISGAGPIQCPLSGGWDSRLLACLLAERGLLAGTFTVNVGLGDARDEELAAAVAAELGVAHEVVEPPSSGYAGELESAAAQLEYQSLLGLTLHRLVADGSRGAIWADGLAGDILIKGLFLDEEIVASPHPRAALFDRAISPRRRLAAILQPRARRVVRRTARDAFLRSTERFEGHPAAATLSAYWTRTHRSVSLIPASVFGASHRLLLPFVSRSAASAALAVVPSEKLGGRLYRRVFGLVNPGVGSLPSTNDALPDRSLSESLHGSAEARRAHLEILARSPLRPWFAPALAQAVERRELGLRYARQTNVTGLQAICSFTLWCERYRELVGEPDPAELLGPPGG